MRILKHWWMRRSAAAFRALGLPVTVFALSATMALAQLTTGTISGTVTDPTGAAIPGASVTAQNTETGNTRQTVTGPQGRYELPNLPSGSYEVRATTTGFQTSVRSGINLSLGQNLVVNHSLQIGEVTQSVTITGEVPLVETTSATVTQLVDEQAVENLPLNNRDLTQLAVLQPGVIKSPAGRGTFGGLGDKITVGGARGTQNLYLMDGVSNSDLSGNPQGASGAYTGAETVKEYQVITNNYSAEYQSAAGAIVSAITKSGTNTLHGSGFWTLRNDNMDAYSWESKARVGEATPVKGEFKRNQFGGSLGGPIIRDKTFVFGSYEGLRERASNTDNTTLMSDAARAGQGIRLTNGQIGNVTVDPRIQPYLDLWPRVGEGNSPTNLDADPGMVVVSAPQNAPVNDDTVTAKLDHQFASEKKGFMSVSYSWNDGDRSPCGLLCEVTEGGSGGNGTISKKHTVAFNHNSVLTPTMLNEFKFGYSFSESAGDIHLGSRDTSALAFHPDRSDVGEINITFGPTTAGFRVNGSTYTQKALQFKEGLSITSGNHSFRFGAEIKRFRYKQEACSRGCNGIYAFRSMGDFLTNVGDDFQVFTPGHESPTRNLRQLLFGSYFQDNWQIAPSLTLNLGMRYEFVTVPDEDNHLISTLNDLLRDDFVAVTEQVAAEFTNEPREFTQTDLQEFFGNPTLKSFSPRFGFAWAPGDRKMSIRGGYGIFYDYPVLYQIRTSLQELPPFVETARLRVRSGAQACRVPLPMYPDVVSDLLPLLSSPTCSSFNLRYMEPNQSNAYVHRWSFTLQRELGSDWVVSAGYTGSRGLHLLGQHLSNIAKWDGFPNQPTGRKFFPSRVSGGNLVARDGLINSNFGEIRTQSSNGNSFFSGLAVGVQKRMSQGLQLQLAYNYSKSTDQGSGVTSGGDELPDGQRGIYYWDIALKKQLSGFDIRNTFTMNFSYELPTQNLTGLAGAVAGGWQLSGILTLTDGHPLTIEDSSSVQEAVIGEVENLRVNLKSGGDNNPVLGGPDKYFDTSHFVPSTCQGDTLCVAGDADYQPGYFGTLGGGTLTSPGLATLDFSLLKNFQVSENHRIQFRGEFFNLFNRPNFGSPSKTIFDTNVPDPSAGRIDSTRGSARQIQLGLRYTF
jgi:hypothetical protein